MTIKTDKINRIAQVLIDLVYPRRCPVCGDIVSKRRSDICPGCERKLTFVTPPFCLRCGKPVFDSVKYCPDCAKDTHVYDEGRAALVYDDYMRKSIYAFKYYGKREYAEYYGRVMYERLADAIRAWDVEAIIPVPIHKSRLRKRGYNQAELIAGQLGKRLGISVRNDLVTRSLSTKVQKDLSAKARQNNLKKAFNVTQNVVKLDSVLIVDDIYTTGATVDAMARSLKGAGIKKVFFAALCIGRGN